VILFLFVQLISCEEEFGVVRPKHFDNLALVDKFFELVQAGDQHGLLDVLDEEVDLVQPVKPIKYKKHVVKFVKDLTTAFSPFYFKNKGCSKHKTSVNCLWTLTGKFVNNLEGIKAHKKLVVIDGASTFHFGNNLITKMVNYFNFVDVENQLKGKVRNREKIVGLVKELWEDKITADKWISVLSPDFTASTPLKADLSGKEYADFLKDWNPSVTNKKTKYICGPTEEDYNHWLCRFSIKASFGSSDGSLKIPKGTKLSIKGMSSIRFNDDDKLVELVDYFDVVDFAKQTLIKIH